MNENKILKEAFFKMDDIERGEMIWGITDVKVKVISFAHEQNEIKNGLGKHNTVTRTIEMDDEFSYKVIKNVVDSMNLDGKEVVKDGGVIFRNAIIRKDGEFCLVVWCNVMERDLGKRTECDRISESLSEKLSIIEAVRQTRIDS